MTGSFFIFPSLLKYKFFNHIYHNNFTYHYSYIDHAEMDANYNLNPSEYCILHIGTAKTGTTSIQVMLNNNKSNYRKYGWHIPSLLGPINNIKLPLYFVNNQIKNYHIKRLGYKSVEIFNDDAISSLTKEMHFAKKNNLGLIISSEYLHEFLKNKLHMRSIKNQFNNYGYKVIIVVYLRNPLHLAVSRLSTAVRNGFSLRSLPKPGDLFWEGWKNLCDHENTIKIWGGIFGNNNIIARKYTDDNVFEFNACKDFNSLFGISLDNIANRYNSTLSATAIGILSLFNFLKMYDKDKNLSLDGRQLLRKLDISINDLPPMPSEKEIILYQDNFNYIINKMLHRSSNVSKIPESQFTNKTHSLIPDTECSFTQLQCFI